MKIKIVIAILLLCQISCKSQIKDTLNNNNTKKDTMKYFDIKKFDENKKGGEWIFTSNEGNSVRQMGLHQDNTYSEVITKNNSPFKTQYIYYQNGLQYTYGKYFYSFPIGISIEYDTSGKSIKETNHDLPYKLSVEDLRSKLKKEFEIDIIEDYKSKDLPYEMPNIQVNRWLGYDKDWRIYKKGVPMYQISFLNKEKKVVQIEINATDGKTIFKQIEGDEKNKNQNKNTLPYIDANENTPNNNLLLLTLILVAIAIVGIIFYAKQQEDSEFNKIDFIK